VRQFFESKIWILRFFYKTIKKPKIWTPFLQPYSLVSKHSVQWCTCFEIKEKFLVLIAVSVLKKQHVFIPK